MNGFQFSRRGLLAASGGLWLASGTGASAQTGPAVETAHGRVRGVTDQGVHIFKAIPYGDTTTGVNRFMPPLPPKSWTGVRDCFEYGPQTPQGNGAPAVSAPTPYTRLYAGRPEAQSEDCLILNVWTPALDNKKRAVMFWIHGGGFSTGSGSSPWYDGTNVARKQDVVVVTINHRLNVFGYCHLGAFSPKYADSSNIGTLDCIAALKWVRDNIERFGGDPGRVMVHGQSGGGRKTSMILSTSPAQGLYHRAVVQSGAQLRVDTIDSATARARRLLTELNITPGDVDKLQQVPLLDLQRAQAKAAGAAQWMPAAGTPSLPGQPFDGKANALSRNVPVMMGTCRTEQSGFLGTDVTLDTLTDGGLKTRLESVQRGQSEPLFALYKRLYPQSSNAEIVYMASTDRGYFLDSTIQGGLRADDTGGAATYMYSFDRETPVDNGRFFAPHAEEIPFVFDSLAKGTLIAGPVTAQSQKLADQVSALWANFARTGVPSAPGIPAWTPYNTAARPTLMIDYQSRMQNDPRAEQRKVMLSYGSQQQANGRA